jgi:hypothetical protein
LPYVEKTNKNEDVAMVEGENDERGEAIASVVVVVVKQHAAVNSPEPGRQSQGLASAKQII